MKIKKEYKPTFSTAMLIISFLLVTMTMSIIWLDIPIHITLITSVLFTIIVLTIKGLPWSVINESIEYGGKMAMGSVMILMIIGMITGSWIASGTVPMMIYWGLKLISPNIFLVSACIICGIISIVTGSSWSSAATIGVALMGVGAALEINPAMTAGADLFDHIKSMVYTTVPGLIIVLIVYLVLGTKSASTAVNNDTIDAITVAVSSTFKLNPILLLPPAFIIVCAIKKLPALPTLILSAFIASIIAVLVQGESISAIANIMNSGYSSKTGVESIDILLSRGGLQNMMWTVGLIMIVMVYGAILEKSNLMDTFLNKIHRFTKTTGSLIATTVVSSIFINFATASQYLAIVIGGRMYSSAFKEKRLMPKVLSRTLEDAGTVVSPLVPWGLCGVFMANTLGVSTLDYAPYAVLCWVVPIIAVIYGYTGLFVWKIEDIESSNKSIL
ncbi:Na+:H+ antiporter, NhaC family [Dethiosulfatibacter aminovorans DSM 17477]|uniref:Na+:H+ antiporter, NhaC family n=1 Tax=Dethiosulfatibacter aminovorans DSM 17477 TaxID=1121476 RepID=A0A1M6HU25_9FIRM|nr:Na+/H+ antiporter NhaC family protein [Dethiosulfatibacter aminovorans]SHJ25695.1 Na+:H+ antiporter, NhaC family [Dethiosulfatibacter aminovorans DSM 17477]